MHFWTQNEPSNAAGVLLQVAAELVARNTALLGGEVIGPRGRLFDQGDMAALLAAAPFVSGTKNQMARVRTPELRGGLPEQADAGC